jgi:hypothetical protein
MAAPTFGQDARRISPCMKSATSSSTVAAYSRMPAASFQQSVANGEISAGKSCGSGVEPDAPESELRTATLSRAEAELGLYDDWSAMPICEAVTSESREERLTVWPRHRRVKVTTTHGHAEGGDEAKDGGEEPLAPALADRPVEERDA